MAEYKDRVKDQTNTAGTGTLTIDGVAATGYRTITAAHTTGATIRYTVINSDGSQWEVGQGVWTAATNTLTRATVYSSSNNGSLVNFSAGAKVVFTGPVAQDLNDVLFLTGGTVSGATTFSGAVTLSGSVSGAALTNYLAAPAAIGGTTPAAGSFTALSASGAVTLSGGTANAVLYLNGSKVATSGSALTFDGTTLGISGGITASSNVIVTGGSIQARNGIYTYFWNSDTTNQVTIQNPGATGAGNAAMAFGIGGTGEVMRLTSTGLGIGTISPSYKLDVSVGTNTIAQQWQGAATSFTLRLRTGNGATPSSSVYRLYMDYLNGSNTGGYIDFYRGLAGNDGYLLFGTSGSDRMTLDSSGNLGLGVTPGANLQVNGSTGFIVSDISQTASQVNIGIGLLTAGRPFIGTNTNSNPIEIGTRVASPVIFVTNSQERMRLDSSGNLGIGTSSPATKLEVSGSAAVARISGTAGTIPQLSLSSAGVVNWSLRSNNDGASDFTIYQDALQRLKIDSSGNLGIGTSSGARRLTLNDATSSYLGYQVAGSEKWVAGVDTSNRYILFDSTASTNRLLIDSSGNVGIGTSSPSNRLEVVFNDTTLNRTDPVNVAAITATSASNGGMPYTGFGPALVFRSQSYNGTIYNGPRIRMAIGDDSVNTTAGTSLVFDVTATKGASPTEVARFDPSGGFGIGETAPSAYGVKLAVVNSSAGLALFTRSGSAGLSIAADGEGPYLATNTYHNLRFFTNSAERARITSGGNFGVGTTTPQHLLVVSNGGANGTEFVPSAGIIQNYNRSTAAYTDMRFDASQLLFFTGSSPTERMRLDSSGNLGIGTSSPGTRLDVSGNIRLSSANASIEFNNGGPQLYVPAGNTLAFATGGGIGSPIERMRLDPSGNLGLGVTPSAWSGLPANGVLQMYGGSLYTPPTGGQDSIGLVSNAHYNGTNWIYKATSNATRYEQYAGIHRFFTAPSGTAGNTISFTQAMTLDASGNLGVGTTSPSTRLHVAGGATTEVRVVSSGDLTSGGVSILRLGGSNSATSAYVGYGGTSSTIDLWNTLAGAITFGTNNTERARITSGGDLLVGKTASDFTNTGFEVNPAGGIMLTRNAGANCVQINKKGNTGDLMAFYYNDATVVGTITNTSTNTAYNTSSDRRLKENIAPAADAGAVIDAIEVVQHDWKVGGHTRFGVIAQDLNAVAPEAVSAGDDGDEIEKTWGVDYSKLVPMLIKEMQSLRARVAQLERTLA